MAAQHLFISSHPESSPVQLYDDDSQWVVWNHCAVTAVPSPLLCVVTLPQTARFRSRNLQCASRPCEDPGPVHAKTLQIASKDVISGAGLSTKHTKTRWKSPGVTRYPSLLGRVSQAIFRGRSKQGSVQHVGLLRSLSRPPVDPYNNIPPISKSCTFLDFVNAFTVLNIQHHATIPR